MRSILKQRFASLYVSIRVRNIAARPLTADKLLVQRALGLLPRAHSTYNSPLTRLTPEAPYSALCIKIQALYAQNAMPTTNSACWWFIRTIPQHTRVF